MKVLTIKQPWATLIMQGDKKYEFRSWKTKYRGEIYIHAGKSIDKKALKYFETVKGKHVELEIEKPLYYAIDGELGKENKVVLDIVPNAINFVIPNR